MKLTKEILIDACFKALENAEELINEANLLLENNHFARAFTLFQFSIEETGKASMFFSSVVKNTYKGPLEKRSILKQVRDHKLKTKASQGIDYAIAMFFENKEIKRVLLKNVYQQSTQIDKINDYKNYSLYLSEINNVFIKPSEVITEDLAKDFKFYAEIRMHATKQLFEIMRNNLDELIKQVEEIDIKGFIENPPKEVLEMVKIIEESNNE